MVPPASSREGLERLPPSPHHLGIPELRDPIPSLGHPSLGQTLTE